MRGCGLSGVQIVACGYSAEALYDDSLGVRALVKGLWKCCESVCRTRLRGMS